MLNLPEEIQVLLMRSEKRTSEITFGIGVYKLNVGNLIIVCLSFLLPNPVFSDYVISKLCVLNMTKG